MKGCLVSHLLSTKKKTFCNKLNLFVVILYALSAVYFAGVMVRLMLTLTPVVCMLSGIAFSIILELYLREENSNPGEAEEEDTSQGGKRLYDKVTTSATVVTV